MNNRRKRPIFNTALTELLTGCAYDETDARRPAHLTLN